MAIQEIHPQTFSDPESLGWVDSAKTHNNNLSDYGFFNEEITEAVGVLAVWSNFEAKGDWEDDGDIRQKITTIGLSVVSIGLRYSDLDSPSWTNPADYHVLKALSTDNVTEQTYSADVPVDFDWTKAKLAAVYEKEGPPETPTLRVFDSWGEGILAPLQVNEQEEFSASESIEFSVGQGLSEEISASGAHALAVGCSLSESQAPSDLCALLTGRTLGETQVVADEIDCSIVGLRLKKAEQQIVLEAVATEVGKSLLDEMTSEDLIGFGYLVSADEGLSGSDVLSKQSLARLLEETGGMDDALGGFGWGREFVAEVPAADLVLLMPGLVKAEQLTASDDVDAYLVTGLLCNEQESAQMTEDLGFEVGTLVPEVMSASEASAHLAGKLMAEAQPIADTGLREIQPAYAETLTANEALAFAVADALTDEAGLSDLLSVLTSLGSLDEEIAPSDVVSLQPGPRFAESLTGADSFDELLTYLRTYGESTTPSDALALEPRPSFPEALSAGDASVLSANKVVAEAAAVGESVSKAGRYHGVDVLGATDVARPVLNALAPPQVAQLEFEDTTGVFYWEDAS